MKNLLALILTLACFTFASCDSEKQAALEKRIAELEAKNQPAQAPVTPATNTNKEAELPPIDPAVAAVFQFDSESYDFGTIKQGETVEHVFKFTNTGKSPLIIEKTQASCGCTVPNHTKTPIAPGETGEISVKFNSTGKSGAQNKAITITANTNPRTQRVFLKGQVDIPAAQDGPLRTE